jgi:hypothetical protein
MVPRSSSPSTPRPSSRSPHSTGNGAALAAARSHAETRSKQPSSRLRDHMLRDHGRTETEVHRLPLADLHRFEHVEQALGLNGLSHQHPAEVVAHPRVPAEQAEAPVTAVLGRTAGHRP